MNLTDILVYFNFFLFTNIHDWIKSVVHDRSNFSLFSQNQKGKKARKA